MLDFSHPDAMLHIPDGTHPGNALARTTHLGIGAHPDDLESIAIDGILSCYKNPKQYFTGVVVCNGAGSPGSESSATASDQNLVQIRMQEQIQASQIGNYNALVMLGLPSKQVRKPARQLPFDDLKQILELTHPDIIYTHNPADRHPTHVGVFQLALASIRHLDANNQPKQFYGGEFWGGLDWVDPKHRISFDCSQDQDLQSKLLSVFSSQNAAKDYPRGLLGRRKANATFMNSHQADQYESVVYALDLMPLLKNPDLQPETYLASVVDEFKTSVISRLKQEEKRD